MNKTKNIVVKEKRSQVSPRFETGLLVMVGVTDRRKMVKGISLWWGGGGGEFSLEHVRDYILEKIFTMSL